MDVSTQALRVLADSSGMSRRVLAARLKRSPSYVSSLISQGSPATLQVLAAMARATGASITLTLADGNTIDLTDAGVDTWSRDAEHTSE